MKPGSPAQGAKQKHLELEGFFIMGVYIHVRNSVTLQLLLVAK